MHAAFGGLEFDACALDLNACALRGIQEARREEMREGGEERIREEKKGEEKGEGKRKRR